MLQIINESYDGCHTVQRTLADASFRPVDHATKESPASPFNCARTQPQGSSSCDTLGAASADKLSYLWGKSLELEYTVELVHKVQRLRDAVPAATEYMDAGYHLHAAAVIQQALATVREIQGYGFFGTNSLCAAVQDVRLRLTSLLSRRLNDLVHGHRHEPRDTAPVAPAPFAAALASTGGDKEPFRLSFTPAVPFDVAEAKDENLARPPDYDTRSAIWNYVHALRLLGAVNSATSSLKDMIPCEVRKLFQVGQVAQALQACEVQPIDTQQQPQQEQKDKARPGDRQQQTHQQQQQQQQQQQGSTNDEPKLEEMFERCVEVLKNYQLISEAVEFFQKQDPGRDGVHQGFTTADVWNTVQNEILQVLKPFLEGNRQRAHSKQQSESKTTALFSFGHLLLESEEPPPPPPSVSLSPDNNHHQQQQQQHREQDRTLLRQSQSAGVVANLRNIIVVHPTVVMFDKIVGNLLYAQSSLLVPILRNYVDGFVEVAYIPALQAFLQRTIDAVTGTPPDTLTALPHLSKRILVSVAAVHNAVQVVCQDILAMPSFCDRLLGLLDSCLLKFFTHCDHVLTSKKTPGSFVSDPALGESLALALMAKYPDALPAFLKSDPLWQPLGTVSLEKADAAALLDVGFSPTAASAAAAAAAIAAQGTDAATRGGTKGGSGSDKSPSCGSGRAATTVAGAGTGAARTGSSVAAAGDDGESLSFVDEIGRFYPVCIDKVTHEMRAAELVLDVRKLALLAEVHTSVEWLVAEVHAMTDGVVRAMSESLDTQPQVRVKKAQRKEKRLQKSARLGDSGRHRVKKKLQSMYAHSRRLLAPATPLVMAPWRLLRDRLALVAARLATVGENALFLLRVEVKLHCVYYLSQCRATLYCCDESESFPDQAVVELNHHLCAVEDALVAHLAPERLRFVVDGVAPLICAVMLGNARALTRVNQPGVRKMLRNVFAVQQNLTVTVYRKERFFDHVRQYYELMYLTDSDDLYRHIAQRLAEPGPRAAKHLYTPEQYDVLLQLLTPGRKVSAILTQKFHNLLLGIDDPSISSPR